MDNFFNNVSFEAAQDIEQASRLIFELRENRLSLLRSLAVADETELLARISDGSLPEHPSYEHYLSASILAKTREALRTELAGHIAPASRTARGNDPMQEKTEDICYQHIELKRRLEIRYADRLDGQPQLLQNALDLCFDNGLIVEIRIAATDEYAINWLWGEAELSIDTAPLYPAIATYPSHFHDANGNCLADPITGPGAKDPWAKTEALIDAILVDPFLGTGSAPMDQELLPASSQ